MRKEDIIMDTIAADGWGHDTSNGHTQVSRIEIGRPQPAPDDPNGDWYCPVSIEHSTEGIVPVYGVGPVDALMNAMMLVRHFADEIREFSPRALEHTDERSS